MSAGNLELDAEAALRYASLPKRNYTGETVDFATILEFDLLGRVSGWPILPAFGRWELHLLLREILACRTNRRENRDHLIHLGHLQHAFDHALHARQPQLAVHLFQAAVRLHDLPHKRAVDVIHFPQVENDPQLLLLDVPGDFLVHALAVRAHVDVSAHFHHPDARLNLFV